MFLYQQDSKTFARPNHTGTQCLYLPEARASPASANPLYLSPSISATVLASGFPSNRLPSSVINRSSSIRIPPK
jgi:hypothetical protein